MDGIRKSTGSQTIQAHGSTRIQVRVDVDCFFYSCLYFFMLLLLLLRAPDLS